MTATATTMMMTTAAALMRYSSVADIPPGDTGVEGDGEMVVGGAVGVGAAVVGTGVGVISGEGCTAASFTNRTVSAEDGQYPFVPWKVA